MMNGLEPILSDKWTQKVIPDLTLERNLVVEVGRLLP